jgi:hypothetical protein
VDDLRHPGLPGARDHHDGGPRDGRGLLGARRAHLRARLRQGALPGPGPHGDVRAKASAKNVRRRESAARRPCYRDAYAAPPPSHLSSHTSRAGTRRSCPASSRRPPTSRGPSWTCPRSCSSSTR